MYLVGDDLVAGPVVRTTEAVSIDAPAGTVWPWLVQMGQDRGGLYTFEKLENLVGLRYVNADRVHPEWQHLAPGDTVRLVPKGWMGLREGSCSRWSKSPISSPSCYALLRVEWNRNGTWCGRSTSFPIGMIAAGFSFAFEHRCVIQARRWSPNSRDRRGH